MNSSDYEKLSEASMDGGIYQKIMWMFARVDSSVISRDISKLGIQPISSFRNARYNARYNASDTRKVLRRFFAERYTPTLKTHCFYNFKGGVGKTSICFQVSAHLALCGYNVLVIDADAQGHISTTLGLSNTESYPTLFDVIKGNYNIKDVIYNVYDGLSCIPANLALSGVENFILENGLKKELLSVHLNEIKDRYDFIMFDTNPTISCLNKIILACSDLLNIVVETNPYSMNGLMLLFNEIEQYVESGLLHDPNILIIPNKYKDRAISSGEAMALLGQAYSQYMKPDFAIRNCEDFNLATLKSEPISFFCRDKSAALDDIIEWIWFFIKRVSNGRNKKQHKTKNIV